MKWGMFGKKKKLKNLLIKIFICHSGLDPESTQILNQVQDDTGYYDEKT